MTILKPCANQEERKEDAPLLMWKGNVNIHQDF